MLKCLLALACLVTLASAQSLNLAFGKQTYQSSTYRSSTHEGDSYQAVDGNADPAMGYSCTSTTYEDTAPWWRVDLDGSYEISHLDIVNRGGGHGKRLRNFEVRVEKEYGDSGSLCHHYNGAVEQGATVIITCDQPVRGRYVLIRKVDPQLPYPDHLLTLCEVRVFGESIDHCETNPCLNGGTCTADGADSYTCLCAAGYTGTNCETAGECEPDVGRCVKKSCPCRDGYRSNHTCAKGKKYCCVPDDAAHLYCGYKWHPCRQEQD